MKKGQLKRQKQRPPVYLESMRKTEELREGNDLPEERVQMEVFQEMYEEEREMNQTRIETTKIDLKEKV